MAADPFALLAAERRRLAEALDDLAPDDWDQPSLCDGWSAHVVAAHLNLPWEVSAPTFLLGVVRARGSIDRAMDRFSREVADRLPPEACVQGLRDHADHRFTPPGAGPEAPLTDVVVHGDDLLRPLGRSVDVAEEASAVVLSWLAGGSARLLVPRSRLADLVFEPTDLDLRVGAGVGVVAGPVRSVIGALVGRRSHLPDLRGDGVAVLAGRI